MALLIITSYTVNERLVKKYEESGSCCSVVTLLGSSIILLAGTIVFLVFQFIWFSGCGGNIGILVVTCVIIVVFFILNLIKTRKDGSVFTAGLISIYIAYLGWSAMASRPDEECNPFKESVPNLISQIVVGATFTFFSLFSISTMSSEA